ncbi:MAG TPA: Flp pilus assembly protein CpaB [Actinomycetota bacterium]|jgi:pilus assembly protein CpaB|nr:Flp pilus assembly protein CpaB [Actinomycetota bacterium]
MVKGRALVVVLALILATVATAGVFLYAQGLEKSANEGGAQVQVVVSEVDIPPRTDLNLLIKDDLFRTIQINEAAYVDGAITSVDQLADKNNAVAILAGEQIPQARITGNVQGGALSIPDGMEALTVSLDAPRGVAGLINTGDKVTIYSTFKEVARKDGTTETVTVVLVPTVELLAVHRPLTSTAFGGDSEAQGEQIPGSLAVTVALTPEDAQRFVFSMETGSTWFGLLPPDASGEPMKPITVAQVVK